mmetsp:Transcript_68785/g.143642  ORF Transcript_68785/g.143642 Transcript_68785/m.143642 type:complete len:216 (+) Transcript_68785:542-1189(+)
MEKAIPRQVMPIVSITELFGDNSATTSSDEAGRRVAVPIRSLHEALNIVRLARGLPELLLVPVSRDHQVQTMSALHLPIETRVIAAREVRDDGLPTRFGLGEVMAEPPLLLFVGPPEPAAAAFDVGHASVCSTSRDSAVVVVGTDVVVHSVIRPIGIPGVRIDHEVVDIVAFVWHALFVISSWHNPVVVNEGVPNLLRPTFVEAPATIVVVAEHA